MNRIKDLRLQNGWKQSELGERIGASRSSVSKYETEDRQLDPATICALCDLFGCTADYLLCRSDTMRPVLSDEDAQLLDAFYRAPEDTQAAIRLLIMPAAKQKKGVS